MSTKLERYQEIQDFVKKDAQDEARQVYNELGSQFDVNKTPIHVHNGIDSPRIPPASLQIVQFLPANSGGVLSPAILGGQVVDNPAEAGFGNPATVPIVAAPVIYGFGTISAVLLLASPAMGATSATLATSYTLIQSLATVYSLVSSILGGGTSGTLTSAWPWATGARVTTFSNADQRTVTYTNGSTAITWSGGLSGSAAASISVAIQSAILSTPWASSTANIVTAFSNGNQRTVTFTNGSTAISWTGALSSGSTDIIAVTSTWGGSSGTFGVRFPSGEVRNVLFTTGTSGLTWAPPLNVASLSTFPTTSPVNVSDSNSFNATLVDNSRFKGGEAPFGTVLFFRNDDDGIRQLWFRSENGSDIATWWGFDAGETNYIY